MICLRAWSVATVMLFLYSVLPAALASEIDSDVDSKRAIGNGSSASAAVFVLPQSGLATIAPEHLEFLEGYDHALPIDQLRAAEWTPRLQADQSLLGGYWVRLRIHNSLQTPAIGIEHNYNTEKKIFAVHTGGIDEYAYWKQAKEDGFI